MPEIVYFALALAATGVGISVFRRVAPRSRFIDVPNERSSHEIPTLRGGGLVVMLVCVLLYVMLSLTQGLAISGPYIIGALIISAVSFLDDLYSLPALVRFAAHLAAAAILVFASEADPALYVPVWDRVIDLGFAAQTLFVLWIVWIVNAYNFMDGIDGLAGLQAVVAGLCWAALGYILSIPIYYLFGGILAFSAIGFLLHNWRPASVFMGDVGSAFFGFTFAAMPFIKTGAGPRTVPILLLASIAFLWMFVADTIFTLLRRTVRKEKIWRAHREHLYQRIVIGGAGHDKVTLLYASASLIVGLLFLAALSGHLFAALALPFAAITFPAFFAAVARRKNI